MRTQLHDPQSCLSVDSKWRLELRLISLENNRFARYAHCLLLPCANSIPLILVIC